MAKLLIFNNKKGNFLKLLGNTINEYEFTTGDWKNKSWTNVIWDARKSDDVDEMKDSIESFCFLKTLDVIDIGHDLREWIESIGGTLHMVSSSTQSISIPGFVEEELSSSISHPIVVSNVCWQHNQENDCAMWSFLQDLGINNINIALSMYKNIIDIHYVKDLKKRIDKQGINVYSLNALFYNHPHLSIFNEFEKYVIHFKKQIEFATTLSAKCVIYGSSSSKLVHISKKYEYEFYKKAYSLFSNTMKQIADIALKNDIVVYLKPNKNNCNFIFEGQQASDIVKIIDHPNVVFGPLRPEGAIIDFGGFSIIEFPCTRVDKAKTYIEHCVLNFQCS